MNGHSIDAFAQIRPRGIDSTILPRLCPFPITTCVLWIHSSLFTSLHPRHFILVKVFIFVLNDFFKILSFLALLNALLAYLKFENKMEGFSRPNAISYIIFHCSNIFPKIISFGFSIYNFTIFWRENDAIKGEMITFNIQGQNCKFSDL